MEKFRIFGIGHIHLVHSWCLYQILIGAFCSYWESEAGEGERQWSSCPNRLAVSRRQNFTSSSSWSCPSQSPKGTGETQRSLRPVPPGTPSFSLCSWSQAQLSVYNPPCGCHRSLFLLNLLSLSQLLLLCNKPSKLNGINPWTSYAQWSTWVRDSVQMAYLPHEI